MGPKNLAASSPPRDLSWIDRMYIKLETMCVEVDKNPSLLLQETSKYVESQVNAVGVNVKKLCTELIQDLISTPMLSPEGGEKKLECALHCKCHCMDSDRPKLIGTDAAGFDNGDDNINDVVCEKKDTMKKEASKVDTRNIMKNEVSKVGVLNREVMGEPQNPRGSEVFGPELKEIHGQGRTNNELKLTTAIGQFETENVGVHKTFDEALGPAKGIKIFAVRQGDLEGNCKSNDTRENNLTSEGSVEGIMETAVCKIEAVFAEQVSRLKANDDKELLGANKLSETHMVGATNTFLRSQEDKWQPQMLEFLQEMRARNIDGLCKRSLSNNDFQNVLYGKRESHSNVDASYAKCEYNSDSSAEDLQAEEVKDTVDGSFHSMYTYDFKDDEPITMSEFFSKEDVHDEEQMAHWFVGEDLRKALQPDIFSVERSGYGECYANEFDLDWELL